MNIIEPEITSIPLISNTNTAASQIVLKGKDIPVTGRGGPRVARGRGSHIT
jgi:hypothetical protein